MLRMTRLDEPGASSTWKLEGKLVGPWVSALREACEGAEGVRLDLSAVSYADAAGIQLLRELRDCGTMLDCTGLVAELLHTEAP